MKNVLNYYLQWLSKCCQCYKDEGLGYFGSMAEMYFNCFFVLFFCVCFRSFLLYSLGFLCTLLQCAWVHADVCVVRTRRRTLLTSCCCWFLFYFYKSSHIVKTCCYTGTTPAVKALSALTFTEFLWATFTPLLCVRVTECRDEWLQCRAWFLVYISFLRFFLKIYQTFWIGAIPQRHSNHQ